MILLAYFGLFAVMLVAAVLHARDAGRPHPVVPATAPQHARLARLYQSRADSYLSKAAEQRQLAMQSRGKRLTTSSNSASAADHYEFVANHNQKRAARMLELAIAHKQMSSDPASSSEAREFRSARETPIPVHCSLTTDAGRFQS